LIDSFLHYIASIIISNQRTQEQPMQTNQIPGDDSQIDYPSATALLIDNDDTAIQPSQAYFASAHIVGNGDSKVIQATETHATATALDPWSKEPTGATTESNNYNTYQPPGHNNTPTYQPPGPVDATAGRSPSHQDGFSLPSAVFEDPMHKKLRRRRRRRARMVVVGASACVVGSVLLGPFGAIALGFAAVGMTRSASKSGERKKDERLRRQLQRQQQM
jgi:hypothetical protein